ncbi:MAG TPA: hypothetical protein VGB68_02695 [Pyrinomonadaceae bacterium]|jgi:preprotein translocase subunit SecD
MISKLLILLLIFNFGLISLSCKALSGLTRKSGTVFTVEIEPDEPHRREIIEQAMRITESKLNSIKADGEVARVPGKDNQISVKIYDSNNTAALKKFLFTSYRLELKKVVSPPYPAPVQTYPTEQAAVPVAAGDREVLSYPDSEDSAFSQFVTVENKSVINGEDVSDAEAFSRSGSKNDYAIYFTLNPKGAAKLSDWTSKNINNYIAVILNKEVKSIAFIKSQISDNGEIAGRFTEEEAENIALSLKSGYLPATMKIIEEKTFQN